jgi:hypothetical protein
MAMFTCIFQINTLKNASTFLSSLPLYALQVTIKNFPSLQKSNIIHELLIRDHIII